MSENTDRRGRTAEGFLGPYSINTDKLGVEGLWTHQHIILGFLFDTRPKSITLPEEKLAGEKVPMGAEFWSGERPKFRPFDYLNSCGDAWLALVLPTWYGKRWMRP